MLVCHCHKVSAQEIRTCAREGGGLPRVCQRLGVGTGCGGCMEHVCEIVRSESPDGNVGLKVFNSSRLAAFCDKHDVAV